MKRLLFTLLILTACGASPSKPVVLIVQNLGRIECDNTGNHSGLLILKGCVNEHGGPKANIYNPGTVIEVLEGNE